MPRAESKSTRSPITMRPRSGRTIPAMAFTSVVFPEPERPKSATMGASLENAASSRNLPRGTATSTSSMVRTRGAATHQPFGECERRERKQHGEEREAHRLSIAARNLRERVDRERQRARLARNVGDEGDGGAEFSQRARERKESPRRDAGNGKRERHGEEHTGAAGAQCARRELDAGIDRLHREPDRAHQQREP